MYVQTTSFLSMILAVFFTTGDIEEKMKKGDFAHLGLLFSYLCPLTLLIRNQLLHALSMVPPNIQ